MASSTTATIYLVQNCWCFFKCYLNNCVFYVYKCIELSWQRCSEHFSSHKNNCIFFGVGTVNLYVVLPVLQSRLLIDWTIQYNCPSMVETKWSNRFNAVILSNQISHLEWIIFWNRRESLVCFHQSCTQQLTHCGDNKCSFFMCVCICDTLLM